MIESRPNVYRRTKPSMKVYVSHSFLKKTLTSGFSVHFTGYFKNEKKEKERKRKQKRED